MLLDAGLLWLGEHATVPQEDARRISLREAQRRYRMRQIAGSDAAPLWRPRPRRA